MMKLVGSVPPHPPHPIHSHNNPQNNQPQFGPTKSFQRRHFRSASPPPISIRSHQQMAPSNGTNMPIPFQRPTAFTMSALDGLQREWLRRDNDKNNHKRPTQQQQFGRPKLAPMQMPAKKIPSEAFCFQDRPNSPPPFVGHEYKRQFSEIAVSPSEVCSRQAEQSLRQFLRLYNQSQLPIRLAENAKDQRGERCKFEWRMNTGETMGAIERREMIRLLAIGLPVEKQPYNLIVLHGLKDLFSGPNGPVDLADSLAIVIPQLRLAFNSCQIWKKLEALEVLREMAQVEGIGQKLVPFFRILLPPLRIGIARRASTETSNCQRDRLVNAIDRTLLLLEQKGGPNAAAQIKNAIPEYRPFYSGCF